MKKLLSIILSILMVVTTIPFALAADGTPVAKVGDVEYTNFATAVANWTDGTTLTLLADTPEYADNITIVNKSVTLDLNGYILNFSGTENKRFMVGEYDGAGGSLTIRDSGTDGAINAYYYTVQNYGTVNLQSGTLNGLVSNVGTFNMTSGKVIGYSKLHSASTQAIDNHGTLNISGGEATGRFGISANYESVTNISGSPVITGEDSGRNKGSAIRSASTDLIITISGTPTLTGGSWGELFSENPITLSTQPADGETWRVFGTADSITANKGVFAIPGEGVTLNPEKFVSLKEGYTVKKNVNGELVFCDCATGLVFVSNGDGTHNTTCNCGEATFDTNVACSGGVATDTHQAYCEYCNAPYGEVNPDVHCDIFAVNMTAEQLQSYLLELLNAGNTDISIVLAAKADKEMFTAINTAFCSSTADAGSVNLTIAGAQTVSNITVYTPDGEKIPLALKTLTLPGATALDMSAITYVSNLEAIYLPNVTSIGVWGLDRLDALNTLVLSAEGAITFKEFNVIDLPFANIDLTLHCNKKNDVTDGTIWQGKTWKSISFAHSWTDGICADCGEVCPHESYTDGVCDNCDYECPHEWGEGVLTRPTFETAGYYTYTCTLCGHSYTEPTKRADDTDLNDASLKVMEYIGKETLTQEAKDEIHKRYLDILKNNGNIFDEFGFVRGDLVEEDQPAINAVTAELEKIVADADEKIASGEYVKIDGMKEYNKIADALDSELMENYSQEEIAALAEKAGDEINARFGEIIEKAEALTGTVAENKDALAEIESEMRTLYGEIKNCLDGVHNGLVYEVTEEAKCEVNAIESATCTLCGETDEREVEGSALEHSFTKYEVTEEAKCGVEGKEISYCDNGCGATDEKEIPALTHKDEDGDLKCDHGCGHEFPKPVDPTPDTPNTPDEPTDDTCDHLCHKDGILGFLWKIISFFYRLFNIHQYCDCGVIHYDTPVFG